MTSSGGPDVTTRPRGRVRDVLFADSEFREPGADGAGTPNSHRRKEDLAVARLDFEVFGGANRSVAPHDMLRRVAVAALVTDKPLQKEPPLPEKNQPVLAAAMRLQCDVLATGDRTHFGALDGQSLHGVVLPSPRSLAEAVLG